MLLKIVLLDDNVHTYTVILRLWVEPPLPTVPLVYKCTITHNILIHITHYQSVLYLVLFYDVVFSYFFDHLTFVKKYNSSYRNWLSPASLLLLKYSDMLLLSHHTSLHLLSDDDWYCNILYIAILFYCKSYHHYWIKATSYDSLYSSYYDMEFSCLKGIFDCNISPREAESRERSTHNRCVLFLYIAISNNTAHH